MVFTSPRFAAVAATASLFVLTACGGGGGGASPDTTNLSGTVAVGAPLANATIALKDANGDTREATTNSQGEYTIANIGTLKAPFIVRATGTAGGEVYELFSASTALNAGDNTLNVTPATTAVLTQVLGRVPAQAFNDANSVAAIDAAELQRAKTRLVQALEDVFAALRTPANQKDLFSARFQADNTGLDKVLDLIHFDADQQGMLKVQNKSNGQYIAISKTASAAPGVLPAPASEVLDLDTSGINSLIANINTRLRAGQNSYQELTDLIDPGFLLGGYNATTFFDDEWEDDTANLQLSSFVIQRCDTLGVCGGYLTASNGGGSTEQLYMMFRRSGGQWRLYGDQKPIDYDLYPMVQVRNLVDTDGSVRTNVTSGVYFRVDITGNMSNANTISKAILEISQDGGQTWQAQANLEHRGTCYNGLVLSSSAGCNNLLPLSADDVQAIDNASQQGRLRARVQLLNASNTLLRSHNVFENMGFATTAQATANAEALGISVKPSTLLDGKRIEFTLPAQAGNPSIDINASRTVGSSRYSTGIWWDYDEIAPLNGVVTLANARSQCKSFYKTDSFINCDERFGDTASIDQVTLEVRQRQTNYLFEYLKNTP
jgi:hypothetical protein